MHYLGIDIGGTTIKAARVDAEGVVLETAKAPTPPDNLESLTSTVLGLASRLQGAGPIAAIGIGIPGLRNARTGTMQTSPHIPGIANVNFEKLLQQRSGLPVLTENDANAGAYGEWRCGAGKNMENMIYISLGTGLG